jgi:glutaredoxin
MVSMEETTFQRRSLLTALAPLNVFTVTWCPHCRWLLAWLDQEGIPYVNHDVDASEADWQVALRLTGGIDIVPVIERNGQAVWGAFTEDLKTKVRQLVAQHPASA